MLLNLVCTKAEIEKNRLERFIASIDNCGEEVDTLYKVDGEELCEKCTLEQFEKVGDKNE